MKLLKVKTSRFRAVIEKCGQPQVYTLWQKPKTDRHFQSLLKNNRVMTIRPSESGTDFGEVGFHAKKGRTLSGLPEIPETFRGRANRGNRLEFGAILKI